MSNNYTHERIPRRADCLQWDGKNTAAVMARLTQHKMIGELYRDIHIQVYRGGSYDDTIDIGMWLVVGKDGALRLYTDDQHKLMYRPIESKEVDVEFTDDEVECLRIGIAVQNEELERLRALRLDVLSLIAHGFKDVDTHYLKAIVEKHGVAA